MEDEKHKRKVEGEGDDFLLLAHEHLFIFRKPEKGEKLSAYKNSTIWHVASLL